MVPLGILTAIAGAIRVQGPRIAKSFIGRGRENRALAEIELMSSTSKEVCELFNGKSIVRAMGRPKLAQLLVYPLEYKKAKDKNDQIDAQRLGPKVADPQDDTSKALSKNKGIEVTNIAVNIALKDSSCGIHTFRTATLESGIGPELLSVYGRTFRSFGHCINR